MSRTYELLCHECRVSIWIGQRNAGSDRPYIYTTANELEKLRTFLFGHQNHRLEFGDDEPFSFLDYKSLDEPFDWGDVARLLRCETPGCGNPLTPEDWNFCAKCKGE